MGKLELLWKYQEADMEVLHHEGEMRRDPTRTKLLRLRNFVVDQQAALQQMEEKVEESRQRVERASQEKLQYEDAVAQGVQKLEGGAFESLEEVQNAIREAQRLMDAIKNAERDLKKVATDAKSMETKLKEMRQKVSAARAQYTTLKAGYDSDFAEQSAALSQLKEKRDQLGAAVEEKLLKRYESVKQQCTPPMAKLNDERCGGCNMSLPAVVLKKVKDGEQVVECENCGRILILS